MKLKKLIFACCLIGFSYVFAQADLNHLSGKYFAADGLEFENMMKMTKKQKEDIEIVFIGEEAGKLANKMLLKWKGGTLEAFLDEKLYNKKQLVWFRAGENTFIELEKGVIAIANKDGSKIGDVLAKDKNKLKDFDMDTAKALVESLMGDLNSEKIEAERKKLMKYPAYKDNIGKVVFAESIRLFGSPLAEPEEAPAKFIKSQMIGKYIAIQAYFDVKPSEKFGKTSEINIEYEFEGQKLDRKSQQKKSRAWANMPKIDAPDYFYFLRGRVIYGDTKYDYTFLQTILNARNKLVPGKSYNMKVTVYAYKDGANVQKLAEGTISLKYEKECDKIMDEWQEWIDAM